MGILNGTATLSGGQQGQRNNGNGNNYKNDRNQNNRRNNHDEERKKHQMNSNYGKPRKRLYSDDDEQDESSTMSSVLAAKKDTLVEFLDEYTKNVKDTKVLVDLIADDFATICSLFRIYYDDDKNKPFVKDLNRLLELMTTNQFANTLYKVLKSNIIENWDEVWQDVSLAVSILLETTSDKMKDETIQLYVYKIIAGYGMWGNEINEMVKNFGITKELAIDLVISIPVTPEKMGQKLLEQFAPRFFNKIVEHAEDNIQVMDDELIQKIFEFMFGKYGASVYKSLGQFLTIEPSTKELNGSQALVYEQFLDFVYKKLDMFDIKNIKFVMEFIGREAEKHKVIFEPTRAMKYSSIRKTVSMMTSEGNDVISKLLA